MPTRSPPTVRSEFVLRVRGRIAARLAGTENPKLPTGDVELRADAHRDPVGRQDAALRHQRARTPRSTSRCASRYRYLDLRREPLQRRILARGRLVQAIREAHHAAGFVEVETPLLIKSTPEGARDFIVPSRLQPGSVYALPQSPQQMKQLLMVAGMDRYFQIARCFRDEDLRGDRQPEFTQLDLEMSFVAEDGRDGLGRADGASRSRRPSRPSDRILQMPFPLLTYREAIDRFGIGQARPALRHGAASTWRDAVADIGLPGVRRRARGRRPRGGPRGARAWRHDPRARSTSSPSSPSAGAPAGLVWLAPAERHHPGLHRQGGGGGGRPRHRDRRGRRRPATWCSSWPTATSMPRRCSARLRVELGESPGPGRPDRARLRLGAPVPDVPVGRGGESLGRHPQPVQRRACPRTSRC